MSSLRKHVLKLAVSAVRGSSSSDASIPAPPPLDPLHTGRFQHFGYPVDLNWMATEGIKHIAGYKDMDPKTDVWLAIHYLIGDLCELAGIPTTSDGQDTPWPVVNLVRVFPTKDMQAKATIERLPRGGSCITLVSLSRYPCNSTEYQPSRKQIEVFSKVFGFEPAWYTSVEKR
ncbi:hypothetical protein CPC08DRAFT_720983 [Agrocybe pediades]|nr:hypothetical protein CPC08DRAFT_720983 [Agrocybe pediades]